MRARGIRLSELDWYCFDIAATARLQDLERQSEGDAPSVNTQGASSIPEPSVETKNGPLYEGAGGAFRLVGDETPPWAE